MKKNKNKIREDFATNVFLIINNVFFVFVLLAMLIPLLKVLSDSFDAATVYGINLFPKKFSAAAYMIIFRSRALLQPLGISIFTTTSGTFLGLAISTIGAYVLTQQKMPGRRFLVNFVMLTMIFNGGLIPTYLAMRAFRLINTLWAVLLPLGLNVYNMILMKNFFEQIPASLLESADMDGCTPFQVFYRIVLPLSKPALASIGLFYAVTQWNEFFHYVMYITNTRLYNFQVKIRELILDSQALEIADATINLRQSQNAMIIVAIIPFMLIYPFCQRYFVQGVTMGAIKE
jgi:putative aldouronate transport system permease protein